MKLKYYLRGLGIGIIVTVILLALTGSGEQTLSDAEIMERASELGMVMEEDTGLFAAATEAETEQAPSEQVSSEEMPSEETQAKETQTEEVQTEVEQTEAKQAAQTETAEAQAQAVQAEAETYALVVQKGDVCRTICERLAEAGIVEDAETLRKYLYEKNVADFISVGTYEIPSNASMEEIARILSAGPLEKQ